MHKKQKKPRISDTFKKSVWIWGFSMDFFRFSSKTREAYCSPSNNNTLAGEPSVPSNLRGAATIK